MIFVTNLTDIYQTTKHIYMSWAQCKKIKVIDTWLIDLFLRLGALLLTSPMVLLASLFLLTIMHFQGSQIGNTALSLK